MDTIQLNKEQLKPGLVLPWDIVTQQGTLLLKKGLTIKDELQIEDIMERCPYLRKMDLATTEIVISQHPYYFMEDCISKVSFLLDSLRNENNLTIGKKINFEEEFNKISLTLMKVINQNTDAVIASLLLDNKDKYPITHSIFTACIAYLLTENLSLKLENQLEIMNASLTMNVSIIQEQYRFYSKRYISEHDKELIKTHPQKSVKILQDAGIKNNNWLVGVYEHHEDGNGSGYPNKKMKISSIAAIIHLADIYTAKITKRDYRHGVAPNLALKELFLAKKDNPNFTNMINIFVKKIGMYPPGLIVRLKSGEIGVVSHRGHIVSTPTVAVLINKQGMPVIDPYLRVTTQPENQIDSVLAPEQIKQYKMNIPVKKIWH